MVVIDANACSTSEGIAATPPRAGWSASSVPSINARPSAVPDTTTVPVKRADRAGARPG
jgi:hypothetical protein